MKRSWRRAIEIILALAAIAILAFVLHGCDAFAIPVRPIQTDKPILVAAVGVDVPQADGTTIHNPDLPQPKKEDFKPAVNGWGSLITLAATLLLGTSGAGVAVRIISKLKTALAISCELTDRVAEANTDQDVEKAKAAAASKQSLYGVRALTQKVRSDPTLGA